MVSFSFLHHHQARRAVSRESQPFSRLRTPALSHAYSFALNMRAVKLHAPRMHAIQPHASGVRGVCVVAQPDPAACTKNCFSELFTEFNPFRTVLLCCTVKRFLRKA